MSNKNTIRFVIENMKDEDLMSSLLQNMSGEDLSNLLYILDTMPEDIQERWDNAIRNVNIWI